MCGSPPPVGKAVYDGWPAAAMVRTRPGPRPSSVSDNEVEDGEAGDTQGEEDQGEEQRKDRPGHYGQS